MTEKAETWGIEKYTSDMRYNMKKLLHSPAVLLISGNQNSGKTFLAMSLAWWATEFGMSVISNVPLVKWLPDEEREVEADYPNYHFVTSFAEAFSVLGGILKKNRASKVLFILDEAAIRFSGLSYMSSISKLLTTLITIIRKLGICLVVVTIRPEALLTKLRSTELFVHVRLMKEPQILKEYGTELLRAGYDPKQLYVIDWPEQDIRASPENVLIVEPKPALAVPVEEARRTGAVYYDTMGLSDIVLGKHPVTGRMFDFDDMLMHLTGIGWEVGEKLYRYMHEAPETPKIPEVDVPPDKPTGEGKARPGVQSDVDRLLIESSLSVRDIALATGCSQSFAYRRRRILRERGLVG
jgi:hypothetical protein